MPSKVSSEGLAELASHEGIVTSPYRDSVGTLTVGIGHTKAAGSPDPASMPMGKPQSLARLFDIFERDIAGVEKRVCAAFTRPLTQAAFDAAASFDFNTGAIDTATWVKRFNAHDDAGARKAFMNWRKPPEIIPRRRAERDLFFDGKYSSGGFATVYPADEKGRVLWGDGRRVKVLDILNDAPAAMDAHPDSGRAAMSPAGHSLPIPTDRPKVSAAKAAVTAGAVGAGSLAVWWQDFTAWCGHVWHWLGL